MANFSWYHANISTIRVPVAGAPAVERGMLVPWWSCSLSLKASSFSTEFSFDFNSIRLNSIRLPATLQRIGFLGSAYEATEWQKDTAWSLWKKSTGKGWMKNEEVCAWRSVCPEAFRNQEWKWKFKMRETNSRSSGKRPVYTVDGQQRTQQRNKVQSTTWYYILL